MERYTGSDSDNLINNSSGGGSGKSKVVQTRALKITRYYDSWNTKIVYSDEIVTAYYKTGYDGSVIQTLYRDKACSSVLCYFRNNKDSKKGDYGVSSFKYSGETTSGSNIIYYYFD